MCRQGPRSALLRSTMGSGALKPLGGRGGGSREVKETRATQEPQTQSTPHDVCSASEADGVETGCVRRSPRQCIKLAMSRPMPRLRTLIDVSCIYLAHTA